MNARATLVAAGLAGAALLAPPAVAYELLQFDPDDGGPAVDRPGRWVAAGPIEYRHNQTEAPTEIDVPPLVDAAFETWNDVPSAGIAFTRGPDTTARGFNFDGENVISYGDPQDIQGTGVLASAVAWVVDDTTHGWQSTSFYEIVQGDIVYNDGQTFTDTQGASLLGGCISGKIDAQAVALHEVGHMFGLDHNETDYAVAIMYPGIAECDSTRANPKADDVDAITYLYDSGEPAVYPAFDVDPERGYAPLTASFTDQTIGTVSSRDWNFGDGGTSTAVSPTHEYASPGLYDVTLTVNGAVSHERVDVVAVYAMPSIDFTADELEGDPPLTVSFTNQTTGAGGAPSFRWRFGDGESSSQEDPTHVYEDPGTYTVTLEVDAGGGYVEHEKAAFIRVLGEEEDELFPGCSCRVAGGRGRGSGLGLGVTIGLAAALVLSRRRR